MLEDNYYLKLQVQTVTQSPGVCYAGCYAKLFYINKKRRKCYTETRYNASYKPGDKARNKASGCGAVGRALPWGNYDRKVNS